MKRFHRNWRKVIQQAPLHRGCTVGATASDEGEVESRPGRDPAFGGLQLNERFNADQVGLAFMNGLETTCHGKGRA